MVFLPVRQLKTLYASKIALLVELGKILPNSEKRRVLLFAVVVNVSTDKDLNTVNRVRVSFLTFPHQLHALTLQR